MEIQAEEAEERVEAHVEEMGPAAELVIVELAGNLRNESKSQRSWRNSKRKVTRNRTGVYVSGLNIGSKLQGANPCRPLTNRRG